MTDITLFGFNNLTKNLSFSLYKLHYIAEQSSCYNLFIKEHYNANKLNTILTTICHAIGGNVLNVAKQDYQPQGASVTLMISEESPAEPLPDAANSSLIAHLDKSHLCIHTYPEESPQKGVAIFRADIELSTCGVISPLEVLNFVIKTFDADVIDIDYRIRGMTRNAKGEKLFTIDKLSNLSEFISNELTTKYVISEHNFPKQKLYHSKLRRQRICLGEHRFNAIDANLSKDEVDSIKRDIEHEIEQLFKSSE